MIKERFMMLIPDQLVKLMSGATTNNFSWQTFQQQCLVQLVVIQSTQMFWSLHQILLNKQILCLSKIE